MKGGAGGEHRMFPRGRRVGVLRLAHRRLGLLALLIAASVLALVSTALAGAPHSRAHAAHRRQRTHAPRHDFLAVHSRPHALLARPGTRTVDLAVSSVLPQGVGALPGRAFKTLVSVKRVGPPKAKISALLSAYLSPRATLAAHKPAVSATLQVSVPAKGTLSRKPVTVAVPIGTAPGQYYVVVCLAALGRFHESHAKNSCASSHTRVTVSKAALSIPVQPLLAPMSAGLVNNTPTGQTNPPSEKQTPEEKHHENEPPGEKLPEATPVPVTGTPPAPGPADAPAPSASEVASKHELSKSESTSFRASIAFLFEGSEAIQKEVVHPAEITEAAAALVHGIVTDTSGHPLGGVHVAVLDHGEFGYTDTATDGTFALAVNGGGTLTLTYARAGYIPVQGTLAVPVNQSVSATDTALTAYQGQADDIDLTSSAPLQVAQGEVESDASGARQATLLFSSGTHATMHLPDGTEQSLTDMHVRATEFTVGSYGPQAMPGSLPPSSEYTYATAFTVDQAVEAGATSVTFNKPVITYVENFLNFPTGAEVPSGTYEPANGQWGASANGVVVKVLSTTGGIASLAVDSSGEPASEAELQELGITSDELKALASLYKPNDTLWRIPLTHFSSWDFNFLPESERPEPPPPPQNEDPPQDESCEVPGGSTILCDSQAMAEEVPVSGTPLALRYQSDRVTGYTAADSIDVPVTSAIKAVPTSVNRIDVEVDILGHTYQHEYCMPGGQGCESGAQRVAASETKGLDYNVIWDHLDGFGRPVDGSAVADVTVTYWVGADYQCTEHSSTGAGATYDPSEFGAQYSSENHCEAPTRQLRAVSDTEQVPVGPSANVSSVGLGEWDLSGVDSYDPNTGVLHSGEGADMDVTSVAPTLSELAGGGSNSGDGEPATEASVDNPQGVLELPNGSVLFAECEGNKVREVLPNHTITTFAGTGTAGHSGDGGPATSATLDCPSSLAQAPDGSIYVADEHGSGGSQLQELGGVIRKIATDGTITTVAGGGSTPAHEAIGKAATSAELYYPGQIALGPDGSLYIADRGSGLIDRVDSAGIFSIVDYDVGTGKTKGVEDPEGLAVTSSGELIVTNGIAHQIVRIDGAITTVIAGTGTLGTTGNGGPATEADLDFPSSVTLGPNGAIYFSEFTTNGEDSIVRAISSAGIITKIAGGGGSEPNNGGIPATAAKLYQIGGIYASSSGSLLISEALGSVFEMKTSLGGVMGGNFLVPTENGARLDEFNPGGRELAAYDPTNGVKLKSFTYDSAGQLSEITDQHGRKTTIQRNGSGVPTEIVAPGGQKTKLTLEDGRLSKITDPDGRVYEAAYGTTGQLIEFTNPNGKSKITYDTLGRLQSDTDEAGQTTTLSSHVQSTPEDTAEKVVTVHLPDGLIATYGDSHDGYGNSTRTVTDPDGGVSSFESFADGTTKVTLPDGTTELSESVGDPRFGLAAPIVQSLQVSSPGHTDDTFLSESRTVELAEPNNPLSVKKLTESVTRNGNKPATTTYEPIEENGKVTGETVVSKSPEGRESVSTFDADGDLIKSTTPTASPPSEYAWNPSTGKLAEIKQGTRSRSFTYDPAGDLTGVSNGVTEGAYKYVPDADGNVTEITDQLGKTYELGYDSGGELSSLKTPSGAEGKLAYTPDDLLDSFLAPGQSIGTSTEYDGERQPRKVTQPTGRALTEEYEAGLLKSAKTSDGEVTASYVSKTSDPEKLERKNSDGSTETMTQAFDGDAPSELSFSGKANGTYSYRYENGRAVEMTLNAGAAGTHATNFSYDEDGLLGGSGAFTITRDESTGLASAIGDGTLEEHLLYNEYGQEQGRAFEVDAAPVYGETLTRDEHTGRITERVEKVGANTNTYDYGYDADGRLSTVKLNGSPSETYTYTPDGDLKTRQSGGGSSEELSYDGQDRETKLASEAYEYDADGQLAKRGADTFTYGTRPGELQSASVGANTVTYDYDALGRRVARTESKETEQFLYGNPVDRYQLTASISPTEVLTVYTYDDIGRLISFTREEETFYVATDTLGSPRVITNSEGTVVDQITYDAYGRVLHASAPSFALAVGYAGSLTDPVTGLLRFGIRDYDPASGRFTERDPTLYKGGLNLYAYAGDDPVNEVDPNGTGLSEKEINETLSKLSEAEKALANEPPPPPSLGERIGKGLEELRNKLADKTGEFIQACKAFANSENPADAVPLVSKALGYAAEQGPISLTPAEAVQQALQKGVEAIQSAPAGLGSGNSEAQYGQVEDGH